MARAVYPYEMGDPDFAWLLEMFREKNPGFCVIEETCLPVVLIGDSRRLTAVCDVDAGKSDEDAFERLMLPAPSGKEQVDENT
ncbi:MAG: hypothetical protein KDD60_04195 [Bdellovibrionales bacterium]|nr:hypothetical protein [Bdellovibrionales bacterium]